MHKLGPPSGYDALLIADSGRVAIQVVPILRKNGGTTTQILGTELWNAEPFIAQNPVMRGALFASVSDTLYTQLAAGNEMLVIQADGEIPTRVHDKIWVKLIPETCHLFDAQGLAVERGRRHPLADLRRNTGRKAS